MNQKSLILNRVFINPVEIKKLKVNNNDTKDGCIVLYCRQYPSSFILQLRTIDKKGNSQYASVCISAEEILQMAEYVKNEIK
jgi:hypothetical protein